MRENGQSDLAWAEPLLQVIESRLGQGLDSSARGEAIRYEIRAAITLLRRALETRSSSELQAANKRFAQIGGLRSRKDKEWLRTALDRLRDGDGTEPGDSNPTEGPSVVPAAGAPPRLDVLVIAALFDPELEQFVARLLDKHELVGTAGSFLHGRTYYVGALNNRVAPEKNRLTVAALFQDRMGMVDCAALTANAVAWFRPRVAAMVGVCAGRAEQGVSLNDIIIPTSAFTYDTGKHHASGFQKEPMWADAHPHIMQRVNVRAKPILESMAAEIRSAFPGSFQMPRVFTDVMACGVTVLDAPGLIDEIAAGHRKVAGVDMESYAFLRAVKLTNDSAKALVVKGVMDLAVQKSDLIKGQAASWAAAFLARFIESEYGSIVTTGS
jgi:hypothetical protein